MLWAATCTRPLMKGRGILALGSPSDNPHELKGVIALEKPLDIIQKGRGILVRSPSDTPSQGEGGGGHCCGESPRHPW